ncbi:thymus-specific serine protease-like [Zerene cesonia]|uniref:thymus-specific serine protease-like n=1 Tax=Zerene cesonia TaxID=33412 RepID=UPI0018E5081F|nr:thymus-specific serine protease-like [Zerene cesonia]
MDVKNNVYLAFLLILYCILCVNSSDLQYETSFNQLTKLFLENKVALRSTLDVQAGWIQQPLDHFTSNSPTWKMRYFTALEYFRQNGPVFIYLGGEGTANPVHLKSGVIQELAQETGGAMFMTEHRYYGLSKPYPNFNAETMKWLSSTQALADIAKLITYIKSDSKFMKSKVVMIGGSYPGNLAAWMRLKYPNLVDAAIASSSPVLAKKDFYEYFEKVNENYQKYGTSNCLLKTKSLFQRYKVLLQNVEGTTQLKRENNICDTCDLKDIRNQWVFFLSKINTFSQSSQYGGPIKIKNHCNLLEKYDTLNNLGQRISYAAFIDSFRRNSDIHAWFYQVCTEFGYFQTTTSKSQPFGDVNPKEFYLHICKDLFGADFNEARVDRGVQRSNYAYGGLRPNVTRVVFVNGDVDPWSTISVLVTLSSEAPAVVIPGAVHCQDLSTTHYSPETLKQATRYVKNVVKTWIGIGNGPK